MKINDIKVIAFDADDTLWDNEPFFRKAEADMVRMLSAYESPERIAESLYRTEMANMPDYGYGAVAFTMSMVENAIAVTGGRITASEIRKIIDMGKGLLHLKATPLPGVEPTLKSIRAAGRFRMVLFTKGELLTQRNKLERSGLAPYFDRIEIVCDKKEAEYEALCREENISPEELLMVGNSLKSDILPALNIGAWAVFVPYEIMWQHEVMEPFLHDRMVTLDKLSEITGVLL